MRWSCKPINVPKSLQAVLLALDIMFTLILWHMSRTNDEVSDICSFVLSFRSQLVVARAMCVEARTTRSKPCQPLTPPTACQGTDTDVLPSVSVHNSQVASAGSHRPPRLRPILHRGLTLLTTWMVTSLIQAGWICKIIVQKLKSKSGIFLYTPEVINMSLLPIISMHYPDVSNMRARSWLSVLRAWFLAPRWIARLLHQVYFKVLPSLLNYHLIELQFLCATRLLCFSFRSKNTRFK